MEELSTPAVELLCAEVRNINFQVLLNDALVSIILIVLYH